MTRQTILDVGGMHCRSCVAHIRKALVLPGVSHVDVRFDEGRVAIDHDPDRIDEGALVAALDRAGYKSGGSCGCAAPVGTAAGCCSVT